VITTFIDRILGRHQPSRTTAKDRLRLVLLHDRTDIPGAMLEQMRLDMIAVLSKYVEIDQDALEVNLEKEDGSVALVASIPIRKVRGDRPADEGLEGLSKADETAKTEATASADSAKK
jgi:cell division topological specificity factor